MMCSFLHLTSERFLLEWKINKKLWARRQKLHDVIIGTSKAEKSHYKKPFHASLIFFKWTKREKCEKWDKIPSRQIAFFPFPIIWHIFTLYFLLLHSFLPPLYRAVSIPWLLSVYDTDTFQERKKTTFFMMSPLTLLRACLVATDEALNRLFIHTHIEYKKAGGRWELRSAKVKHTLEYEDENIINLLFATRYREVVLL